MAAGWQGHGHHDEPTVQPRTLSSENPVIGAMAQERRRCFATALYFTVLIDQVMFTHFQADYDTFRRLTAYPKFRGDCPGSCGYHIHPENVFAALAQPAGSRKDDWLPEHEVIIREAVPTMKGEVLTFFREHMSNRDGVEVWAECAAEPPLCLLESSRDTN